MFCSQGIAHDNVLHHDADRLEFKWRRGQSQSQSQSGFIYKNQIDWDSGQWKVKDQLNISYDKIEQNQKFQAD